MRSTKNSRGVIVGIFIVIGLIIFMAGVLTLGGQRNTFSSTVKLKAVFDDVQGLKPGNNIWLSGVKIGTVRDMEFNETGDVVVEMQIDEKKQSYIRKDTKAKVGSDGLIGNKIIVLYGGTAASPVVQEGDRLAVEKIAGMEDMMATLQSNNENLLDITTDFKVVSQRLANGEGSIGKLLKDETLSNSLENALANLQKAAGSATEISRDISNYTSRLDNKGTLANDLVSDTIVFSKLRSSVAEIERLSKAANDVVKNLETASAEVSSGIQNVNSPVGALLHDEQTAANLKATIKNLQTSTEKLDENMEALQHNFLLRGFFKKKAKKNE